MTDFLCAAAAGCLGRFVTHPLDTLKTVTLSTTLQQESRSYREVARLVFVQDGIRGLYRGVGIACLGSAPAVALYLWSYDAVKSCLIASERLGWGTPLVHLTSGFAAEAVSCVLWVPIDVIKERLQFQPASLVGRYRGSVDGLRTIMRLEGLNGLYKGYFSTLAAFGPYSGAYFVAYEYFLKRFNNRGGGGRDAKTSEPTAAATMLAALLGNAVACTVTNPLEVVKTRRQVQGAMLMNPVSKNVAPDMRVVGSYTSVRTGLIDLWKREGVSGYFRGLGSRVLYSAPNAAITMTLFQYFKQSVAASHKATPSQ